MRRVKPVKIRFAKNKKKRWYWTAISPNGKKFFQSTEPDGYASRYAAVKNFRSVERMFVLRNFKFV